MAELQTTVLFHDAMGQDRVLAHLQPEPAAGLALYTVTSGNAAAHGLLLYLYFRIVE